MTETAATVPAFSVRGLSFRYDHAPDCRWALRHVQYAVEAGTIVGIIGPNGSGKTSLLKLLMKLLHPESGEIRVFGKDIETVSPATLARRIAFVPQETPQLFPFTLGELVLMGRFPFHQPFAGWGWDAADDVRHATRAMHSMEIASLANRMMSDVSGGERQRAMIARALTQDADVLLLDEPTAFLDLHHQLDIARKLRQLNREQGLTVVMVSHDLNLASQCCDQLLLLHQGEIAAQGHPADVIRSDVLEPVYRCEVIVDQHPRSHAPRVAVPV